MLNYETLLSSYDDKLTLMQWLKKVEAALKDASAVAFNVTKTGDATLTFSLDFEDGSKIESGPIVLQQGESVASAAISNGHLLLTLTNGDVLDAGNIFNGDLSLSGNLSVTGTISGNMPVLTTAGNEISAQKPVVEVMNGYLFYKTASTEKWTYEYIYAGVVKNGNKLTFCIALNLTCTDNTAPLEIGIGYFEIPTPMLNRLYPSLIGGAQMLDDRNISVIPAETYGTIWQGYAYSQKRSTDVSFAVGMPTSARSAGQKSYVRYEVTYLLSENLAA